jgi:hypothetical protein
VERLQNAFADRDMREICRSLSSSAKVQAGTFAEAALGGQPCPEILAKAFSVVQQSGGWKGARTPAVDGVSGRGSTRLATLELDGWQGDIPFTKEAGRWKLDGFFGASLQRVKKTEAEAWSQPFPQPQSRLSVRDATGRPCPPFTVSKKNMRVTGGCTVEARGERLPIKMMTPFGDLLFGLCSVTFTLRVDSTGRALLDGFNMEGGLDDASASCGDVSACSAPDGRGETPWKAQISEEEGEDYAYRADVCIWTCVGSFVGPMDLRVRAGRDGRKALVFGTRRAGIKIGGLIPLDGVDVAVQRVS